VFYKGLETLYKRIIEDVGPIDIIHCHSSILSGYSAMKISEKYDIPYIITEHYTGFARGLINNNKECVIKRVFDKSEAVIAVSNSLKNDIKDYCKHKEILVIPNMVDTSVFSVNVKRDSDEFTFLSVCYLTHKKGIDILLKAFSIAFKDKDNVKLEIGGDGEESNNLKILSKNLGLENKVNFLGNLTRDEVVKVIQNCDAFVLPSRFETFGVVFIEALACGKPIIATRGEGPNDIVNEFNGILVEKENIDDLVDAMKSLYNNHYKYNASKIMHDCEKRFSEESVSKMIIEVYERILKS
jgi:glycosyltransferase involved in cell wall biosynthesis